MKRIITHSECQTFQDCPKKWWFKYDQRLSVERPKLALSIGKIVHSLIAEHSLGAKVYPLTDEILTKIGKVSEDAESAQENIGLIESMIKQYLSLPLEATFDEIEVRHSVPLFAPSGRASTKWEYEFTPDALLDIGGQKWLHEIKTAATIDSAYVANLILDEQISRYAWAMEQALECEIVGVVYTILKKKVPSAPNVLKNGQLSKDKNQDTTYELYSAALDRLCLPHELYRDMLDMLQTKGNTFIYREKLYRSKKEKVECAERLHNICRAMSQGIIYKCPGPQCQWKCDYRPICIEDTPEARSAYTIRPEEQYHQENTKEVANE